MVLEMRFRAAVDRDRSLDDLLKKKGIERPQQFGDRPFQSFILSKTLDLTQCLDRQRHPSADRHIAG